MRKIKLHAAHPALLFGALIVVVAAAVAINALPVNGHSAQPPGDDPGGVVDNGKVVTPESPSWSQVEELINEQKMKAALELVEEILAAARETNASGEWTRALIEQAKLRMTLHGYETAVRQLREAAWPDDTFSRAVLNLMYAHALRTYADGYSWEIRQRERVETSEEIDLKSWTMDQIVTEAHRAYADVWKERNRWGSESLGSFARYINQNNYPARIRGTLRDAVTYMWVELLVDTSLWTPRQSGEIYRLDADALIAGDPDASSQLDLEDAAVHPLLKLGALLDDLEAWHSAADRDEAALEASLERVRRLASQFENADDKVALRRDLFTRLGRVDADLPWWSMGQHVLAGLLRNEAEPDALVSARDAAKRGLDRHPDSFGGRACRSLVASFEAPSYRLETMSADGFDRRSIQITHKNLDELHFRAWRLDLEELIEDAEDYNLLPGYREIPEILRGRSPDTSWRISLPETVDLRDHRTFVEPPMRSAGLWLVAASARRDFKDGGNLIQAVNLILTDLVLETASIGSQYEVFVRSGRTGDPVPGASVAVYRYDWHSGHKESKTYLSDQTGRFIIGNRVLRNNQHFLFAKHGDDIALDAGYLTRLYEHEDREETSAMLYSDRSVYRPGQKLYFKVVAYKGRRDQATFKTLPKRQLTVTLRDANNEEVASQNLTCNSFGSASGEFEIPSGRLLGSWNLYASLGGSIQVRVEEYRRPTFEVTVNEPAQALRLNRPAELEGEVRYYFGLPVTDGQVAWRVTREPVVPRWWYWWLPPPSSQPQVVASGETDLDADGAFKIAFTPEADEREASVKGMSYRYRLSADVTDEGGETRSASRVFRLGFVTVEARVESGLNFYRSGKPIRFTVRRMDLDGVGRAGTGSWRLVEIDQPERTLTPADEPMPRPTSADGDPWFRTPGDLLRPRWNPNFDGDAVMASWPDGRSIDDGTSEHNDSGGCDLDVDALSPGAYRLIYQTTDDFGAEYELRHDFIVVGARRTKVQLPSILIAERTSVPVGDSLRLFVRSGLDDQPMLLETFKRGRRIAERTLRSGRDGELIEIPIGPDDRGGFTVRLRLLRDHQDMQHSVNVLVPWDDRELSVELATFRDTMRPGTHETFSVTVKAKDGAPVDAATAELLAYMYDRSLDIFGPHNPFNPIGLYPYRYGAGSLSVSLGHATPSWHRDSGLARIPSPPHLHGDHLKVLDGYGIGGPGYRGRQVMKMAMPMAAAAPAEGEVMMAESAEFDMALEESVVVGGAVLDDMGETQEVAVAADEEPEQPSDEAELRSDFAETAFFEPHVLINADGAATVEFDVPDSVTEWNLWVHALTRDIRAGSLTRTARSVKELMVRPYLPRFMREGDTAALKVVVNNAGDKPLTGTLDLEILDPDTNQDLRPIFGLDADSATGQTFTVEPDGGTALTFPIKVPARVGTVAFKVVARADGFSDGELRALPVLPGRMHLVQSKFVTLKDTDHRTMRFADMAADDDPSLIHDQLVVTVDAQLFYSVLNSLPYLVNYPYECTEQTLNRFVSTGILSSLYDNYPAVKRMAAKFSERDVRFETFDDVDPNRKMTLEETPWLVEARGGAGESKDLINVLDPRIANAQRKASLAKLKKAQTSIGAFPWWPGGPPSPYMTLYILYGFSKALEFDVEVPREVVVRAWAYMHRHYIDEVVDWMMKNDCCWEHITFLNYVLSSYPDASWTGGVFTDDERERMLNYSFKHWKQHSPLLKGYLALTLERAGRHDAAVLVFDSVMDSSTTTEDEGTFWAPEDRAWLWYNDTIETHAFALRTVTELEPDDARRHGLVHWLLLNKKLNHWKSTRATAEVIYSLIHYLEHEGALAVREDATVKIGPRTQTFVFEPDEYTGKKNQIVVAGPEVDPATMSEIEVSKTSKGFAFASATWHFSTERLPDEARGDLFAVTRSYFKRVSRGDEWILQPIADGTQIDVGDQIEVQLSIRAKHAAEYVHLRDPRGAGFEPETLHSQYKWDLGISWYEEVRDSGTNFFFEWLPAGEYTFKYRLRASMAGTFRVSPATLQSMYAPEFAAYSAGNALAVEEQNQ